MSTGKVFGSHRSSCLTFDLGPNGLDDPLTPGVAGGVKAGEMSVAGSEGVEEPSGSQLVTCWGEGRGRGASIGEACEGNSGIFAITNVYTK